MKRKETPKIEWTEEFDISWHLEGGEIVVDRWNFGGEPAPFDSELFNTIWPPWMLEAADHLRSGLSVFSPDIAKEAV